jgi:hypothetical protein
VLTINSCDIVAIETATSRPTGHKKTIAEFILAWFQGNGLKAVRQEVEVDRPNAVNDTKRAISIDEICQDRFARGPDMHLPTSRAM